MKIIILQGVPCSGKSTWAREFVKTHKDYVIVSRDAIREMSGVYWMPEREDYISCVEYDCVYDALKNGFNVIIDAVNFNPKTLHKWETAANGLADIEYKRFDVTFEEAVRRDKERGERGEKSVGEDVIRTFFSKYLGGI